MQSSHLFILLILVIIFGSKMLGDYLKGRAHGQDKNANKEAEKMMTRIDELEERIRVLEQIVTDPRESLSRKINNL